MTDYLIEIDRNDLIDTFVNKKTYPGWGYMVEQGGPPENLDALVPEWLPYIPDDPFRDAPIASTTIDGEFVIYSIGPDMTDNSGMAIEGYAKEDSEGDMVVTL